MCLGIGAWVFADANPSRTVPAVEGGRCADVVRRIWSIPRSASWVSSRVISAPGG